MIDSPDELSLFVDEKEQCVGLALGIRREIIRTILIVEN